MNCKYFAAVVVAALCAGCGGPPVPPSKLVKPASILMVPPEKLPAIKAGEDLGDVVAKTRRSYGREIAKLRRLQRYVHTVTR